MRSSVCSLIHNITRSKLLHCDCLWAFFHFLFCSFALRSSRSFLIFLLLFFTVSLSLLFLISCVSFSWEEIVPGTRKALALDAVVSGIADLSYSFLRLCHCVLLWCIGYRKSYSIVLEIESKIRVALSILPSLCYVTRTGEKEKERVKWRN